MAILLHASLLLTFSYSVTLGLKISLLMWKLKNDLASLSIENKSSGGLTAREASFHGFAWLVCLASVTAIVVYEHTTTDAIFGFGERRVCLATSQKGMLYLIIIPTVVTLLLNIITTVYSGVTLTQLMRSRPLNRDPLVPRLLLFLGRMISFQSLQWALGLVYYVTQVDVVGFLFEIFLTFEGFIISSSYLAADLFL